MGGISMNRGILLALPLLAACASGAPTLEFWDIRRQEGHAQPGNQGGLALENASIDELRRSRFGSDLYAPPVRDHDVRIATAAVALDPARVHAPETAPPERPRQAERLVIYNGSLAIQVPEPERVEKEITSLVKQVGGWVQKLDGPRLPLRVPSARFDDTFARIAALGQVLDRKISGNDVTDQFRDLKLRLENGEKLRARLAAILEQAKNVQDALAVGKELTRVTEEIERLKGAMAQMQDQVSYSTLAVDLRRSMPSRPASGSLPFLWVRQLGLGSLFYFER